MREETRCSHMGYSFRLTARVLLYASSHRQDNTYHGLWYTSRGALAGSRNSSMGRPWRIDPATHRTMSECSYHGAISRSLGHWRILCISIRLHVISIDLTGQVIDNRTFSCTATLFEMWLKFKYCYYYLFLTFFNIYWIHRTITFNVFYPWNNCNYLCRIN